MPVEGITAGLDVTPEEATDAFIGLAMPGAGLWATAADVLRFGQDVLRVASTGAPGLLSAPALELMTRDHTGHVAGLHDDAGQAVSSGLGWGLGRRGRVRLSPGSDRVVEHDGVTGGTLWIDPDWDLVVVFLAGSFGADPPVRRTVLQVVYSALRRAGTAGGHVGRG